MKRETKTVYLTEAGRQLIELRGDTAYVNCFTATADELCELAMACRAAAEELRVMSEMDSVH